MTESLSERADLRSYYEREAALGTRTDLRGPRVELRSAFVELLLAEGRHSVVDFGSGPGLDAAGFDAAGLWCVGLDLAIGNARSAADRGVTVLPASIDATPLKPHSFAAGWSMSTLMHLTADGAGAALDQMASCLQPGAPLQVGLWGGKARVDVEDTTIEGEQRPFHLRPAETNLGLVAEAGSAEILEVWDVGPAGWEYQVLRVRIGE